MSLVWKVDFAEDGLTKEVPDTKRDLLRLRQHASYRSGTIYTVLLLCI